jgi:hypothetical protein
MLLLDNTGDTKLLAGIELILLYCPTEVPPSFTTLGIMGAGLP